MSPAGTLDRREFLKKTAAGGTALVIGFYLPSKQNRLPLLESLRMNAWVRIASDNTVTLIIDKSEMGQGVVTSLAMLLAEELECDWKKVKTEFAPAAPEYFNPLFGLQGTGGSTSVRASWGPLTKAGAAAREMLVAAAAKQSERLQIYRQAGETSGHSFESERKGRLRNRCACSANAACRGGALPRFWRQSAKF